MQHDTAYLLLEIAQHNARHSNLCIRKKHKQTAMRNKAKRPHGRVDKASPGAVDSGLDSESRLTNYLKIGIHGYSA